MFWFSGISANAIAGEQMAVTRDVVIVFSESLGEEMTALIVGDEIHILLCGGRQRGTEGSFARICNGAGGKAGMLVSVIRGIDVQVRGTDIFRVVAFQFQRVLHGGIALKRQVFSQAVIKDSSNHGTLFGLGSFAFDQRG